MDHKLYLPFDGNAQLLAAAVLGDAGPDHAGAVLASEVVKGGSHIDGAELLGIDRIFMKGKEEEEVEERDNFVGEAAVDNDINQLFKVIFICFVILERKVL